MLTPDLRDVWMEPLRGQSWAGTEFRRSVAPFVRSFAREHDWVRKGSARVEEKFATTNVNVRSAVEPIRDELRVLVFRIIRNRDSRGFECSCVFGAEPELGLQIKLDMVRTTFRELEKGTR